MVWMCLENKTERDVVGICHSTSTGRTASCEYAACRSADDTPCIKRNNSGEHLSGIVGYLYKIIVTSVMIKLVIICLSYQSFFEV